MTVIKIEGFHPLVGNVNISGSRNSALKLLFASMFSNEDIILENIPGVGSIFEEIEIIKSIGGTIEWTGSNRLLLSGSNINSYEIPYELGSRSRTCILLSGPLLYRFGKANIPKYKISSYEPASINRLLNTYKDLGISIEEDDKYYKLSADNISSNNVSFKVPTHIGTDNALLCTCFLHGQSVISGASQESEIDDLINFLNIIGADITCTEPGSIIVNGTNIFKGGSFEVSPDKTEAAIFATAAVLTNGNILLNGVDRTVMIPFVNFLNKIGARFEFSGKELKVWRHYEELNPINLNITPTPGFVPDWQPLAAIMLTQASGESYINDQVYLDRFDYHKDLNRMGADVELIKPSDAGMPCVISDDRYDIEQYGEPKTVLKVKGPSKMRSERLNIVDFKNGPVLVLSSLCAEGKSEINGIEHIDYYMENFLDKLYSLGAKIWRQ